MRKIKFFSILTLGVLLIVLSIAFGVSANNKTKHFQIDVSMTDLLPVEFKKAENLRANKDKIGLNSFNSKSRLLLNFKVNPIQDDTDIILEVSGNGVIKVENENYPFKVEPTSRLRSAELESGDVFMWGVIDAYIVNSKGKEDVVSMGLAFIPETNESFLTCTIGSLDEGLAAMTFGQDFGTEEMRNLVLGGE